MNRFESPTSSLLDQLLEQEIRRMSDPNVSEPPEEVSPMALEDYRDEMMPFADLTSSDHVEAFLKAYAEGDFFRDLRSMYQHTPFKALPVFMAHPHGYPKFDPADVEDTGYLYLYILSEKNQVADDRKRAFLDAVMPAEIIANSVEIPLDYNSASMESMRSFHAGLRKATEELMEMMKG